MPLLLAILCLMALAYRYYSAFLAAKVAALDDAHITPASRIHDGQNYHPTNKWVLFGHHFAAISGAGPLIGPVLAAQFGYMPGLLWIVIGVCLAGAVQDFLTLAASIRRGGKSLAQIAYTDIGRVAGIAATAAILFIIVIALAGLGKVVVKALGGETVAYPNDSMLIFPGNTVKPWGDTTLLTRASLPPRDAKGVYIIPAGTKLVWNNAQSVMTFTDSFQLKTPAPFKDDPYEAAVAIPAGSVRLVPGSAWGTFTIAATVPIALFVGLYMYKIRKGKVVEASLIGGALTLLATFIGGWVAQHPIGQYFNLTANQVTFAMAMYGFIASVLPVWVLLCPRDYLSSFLKIGTIALLVFGTLFANPKLEAPSFNHIFFASGPTVSGPIFPFLFITIMCGAISGFHALVSSGTTPKMIKKETDARTIGYGAMLIEGLVGVVAMIAYVVAGPDGTKQTAPRELETDHVSAAAP
jgi:carbon starvation protein